MTVPEKLLHPPLPFTPHCDCHFLSGFSPPLQGDGVAETSFLDPSGVLPFRKKMTVTFRGEKRQKIEKGGGERACLTCAVSTGDRGKGIWQEHSTTRNAYSTSLRTGMRASSKRPSGRFRTAMPRPPARISLLNSPTEQPRTISISSNQTGASFHDCCDRESHGGFGRSFAFTRQSPATDPRPIHGRAPPDSGGLTSRFSRFRTTSTWRSGWPFAKASREMEPPKGWESLSNCWRYG